MPNNEPKYNPGDTVYLLESNRIIREVKVVRFTGGFYIVRFTNREGSSGGMRVRASRLFPSEEAAKQSIPTPKPAPQPTPSYTSPWDWKDK